MSSLRSMIVGLPSPSPAFPLSGYCIALYLLPVLNPKSYDGARVLEASGRPIHRPDCQSDHVRVLVAFESECQPYQFSVEMDGPGASAQVLVSLFVHLGPSCVWSRCWVGAESTNFLLLFYF